MPAPAIRIAARYALAGAAGAALLLVLGRGMPLAAYGATLVTLLAVFAGTRAIGATGPDAGFRSQLAGAALIALGGSLGVGAALYALYARLAPGLLAERLAAKAATLAAAAPQDGRSAAELARLAAHRAQYLDPAFQAFSGLATTLFLGVLFGAYLAWRARLLQRLRAGRSSPRR